MHLCCNVQCLNPWHLAWGKRGWNSRRDNLQALACMQPVLQQQVEQHAVVQQRWQQEQELHAAPEATRADLERLVQQEEQQDQAQRHRLDARARAREKAMRALLKAPAPKQKKQRLG